MLVKHVYKILLFFLIFLIPPVGFLFGNKYSIYASEKPQIIYFYQETCQECQAIEPFLVNIEERYEDKVAFEKLEVTKSQEARNAYFAFANAYNLDVAKIGVPLIFIGGKSLLGKDAIVKNLDDEIKSNLQNPTLLAIPLEEAKKIPSLRTGEIICADQTVCKPSQAPILTLPLVVGAAAVDSINPCAIAVLIILISFLLGIQASRGRLLSIGLIYIGAVYFAYLLAGLGILKFIQVLPIRVEWILIIASFLLFIFAILSFSDAYSAVMGNSKPTLAIPTRAKPLIGKYLAQATILGALIAGIIVSFVELPCTGAIYFGILSLLASSVTFLTGLSYLLLYNLIFVAPLLLILFAGVTGKNIKIFEKISHENKALVKALMGIIIMVLIIAMLWPIWDFISFQLKNLSSLFGEREISSITILIAVIISITVFYFLLAYLKPIVTRKIKVFFCAICYAVAATWLWLLALLILGFKFDTKILALLLGMSVVGIMYQLEKYFAERNLKGFWLLRIILIDVGILLICGILFISLNIFLAGLAGVLILILLFFYLAVPRKIEIEEAPPTKEKNKALKELSDRLENCC
jgi:cytochrome c biogenesis protein CcdA/thiol-disulfide isomerase/thioredoxin